MCIRDSPGAAAIVSRVVNNAEPGAIILLHQSAPDTLEGLQSMITQLRQQGYDFGTVTQVISPL